MKATFASALLFTTSYASWDAKTQQTFYESHGDDWGDSLKNLEGTDSPNNFEVCNVGKLQSPVDLPNATTKKGENSNALIGSYINDLSPHANEAKILKDTAEQSLTTDEWGIFKVDYVDMGSVQHSSHYGVVTNYTSSYIRFIHESDHTVEGERKALEM